MDINITVKAVHIHNHGATAEQLTAITEGIETMSKQLDDLEAAVAANTPTPP